MPNEFISQLWPLLLTLLGFLVAGIGTLLTVWFKGISNRKEQADKLANERKAIKENLEIALLKLDAQTKIGELAIQATEQMKIMRGKSDEERQQFALNLTQILASGVGASNAINGSQIYVNEAKVGTETPHDETTSPLKEKQ